MIASISGRVLDGDEDSLLIEIGGVGLRVMVPNETRSRAHPGSVIFLHTVLVVRQESLALYGFESQDERKLFNLLLGVNGVGPRLALAVLSCLSTDAIRRAIFHEQAEIFNQVPGVGKKTAQKILLHLHDRVTAEAGLEPIALLSEKDNEVLAALTALGYSVVEAQAALQTIPRDDTQGVEDRLRLALQYFSKP